MQGLKQGSLSSDTFLPPPLLLHVFSNFLLLLSQLQRAVEDTVCRWKSAAPLQRKTCAHSSGTHFRLFIEHRAIYSQMVCLILFFFKYSHNPASCVVKVIWNAGILLFSGNKKHFFLYKSVRVIWNMWCHWWLFPLLKCLNALSGCALRRKGGL